MSMTMPPSTTDKGNKLSVTQRRKAAKARKANAELENSTEATSELTINSESQIYDQNKVYPKRSDVSEHDWNLIVQKHNARTKAERRLFEYTKLLPQKCRIDYYPDRMLEYKRLVVQKVPLPEDPIERARDDVARRNAIAEIMWAREVAGFEPVNEAAKWNRTDLDVTKELNAKFDSKYFLAIKERRDDRKAHRNFMEDNMKAIEHTAGGTISKSRKHWLRSRVNVLVCAPEDAEAIKDLQKTSIQVIYWIIVRRAEAGIPLELTHSSPSTQTIATHEWLMEQPLSFFEQDDFGLDTYFDIELEEIKNLTRREKEEHSDDESNDSAATPGSMEGSEFNPEEVAEMDADLNALSNEGEHAIATSATAAVYTQISAHNRQSPISHHTMLPYEVYYDIGYLTPEPVRARKRQRSSSPQDKLAGEDDYDNDFMYPEPVSPVRAPKRRRSMSP